MAIDVTQNMTEEEKALYFQNFAPLKEAGSWNWADSTVGNPQVNNFDAFNSNSLENFNNNQGNVNSNFFNSNQFQGLLNQDANYVKNAKIAKDARNTIANTPSEPFVPSMDNWNWAYGGKGMPEVSIGTFNGNQNIDPISGNQNIDSISGNSTNMPAYNLGYGLTKESSNYDVMNAVRNLPQFSNDQEIFNAWMAPLENGNSRDMFDWANISNPEIYTSNITDTQLTPENKAWFNKILNTIYSDGTEGMPSPAPGYANPNPSGSYANPLNSTGER